MVRCLKINWLILMQKCIPPTHNRETVHHIYQIKNRKVQTLTIMNNVGNFNNTDPRIWHLVCSKEENKSESAVFDCEWIPRWFQPNKDVNKLKIFSNTSHFQYTNLSSLLAKQQDKQWLQNYWLAFKLRMTVGITCSTWNVQDKRTDVGRNTSTLAVIFAESLV